MTADSTDELLAHRFDAVQVLTLNRPDRANTLTPALASLLAEWIHAAGADPAVHAIVLTGAGKVFCGGFDLGLVDRGVDDQAVTDLMAAVRDSEVPTVVAMNGAAVGAGLELACSCDIRVARSLVRIGLPAVRIGVAYRFNGLAQVLSAVGSPAVEMLLSGGLLTADQCPGFARDVGDVDPLAAALEIAGRIADASWPAVSYTMRVLRVLRGSGEDFDAERARIMIGDDIAEAALARAAGRKPSFSRRPATSP